MAKTRTRTPEQVCKRKRRYGTYESAFRETRRLKDRVRLFVYRCPVCDGYHHTHIHPDDAQ